MSIANKQKVKAKLLKQIERSKEIIAKERDIIRDYLSDLESIDEACDKAIDSLESAADALSEYL